MSKFVIVGSLCFVVFLIYKKAQTQTETETAE